MQKPHSPSGQVARLTRQRQGDAAAGRRLRRALARLAAALGGGRPAAQAASDPHAPIRTVIDPRDIYLS